MLTIFVPSAPCSYRARVLVRDTFCAQSKLMSYCGLGPSLHPKTTKITSPLIRFRWSGFSIAAVPPHPCFMLGSWSYRLNRRVEKTVTYLQTFPVTRVKSDARFSSQKRMQHRIPIKLYAARPKGGIAISTTTEMKGVHDSLYGRL